MSDDRASLGCAVALYGLSTKELAAVRSAGLVERGVVRLRDVCVFLRARARLRPRPPRPGADPKLSIAGTPVAGGRHRKSA
jgi:hypothetical protein